MQFYQCDAPNCDQCGKQKTLESDHNQDPPIYVCWGCSYIATE